MALVSLPSMGAPIVQQLTGTMQPLKMTAHVNTEFPVAQIAPLLISTLWQIKMMVHALT